MFFKRGDFGIVVGRKVNLRPLGDVLHENTFLAQFSNNAVKVQVFTILISTLDAKQLFKLSIKTSNVFLKILLKGLVVVADVRESLALAHDVIVVATFAIAESLDKILDVVFGVDALVFLNISHLIAHTSF